MIHIRESKQDAENIILLKERLYTKGHLEGVRENPHDITESSESNDKKKWKERFNWSMRSLMRVGVGVSVVDDSHRKLLQCNISSFFGRQQYIEISGGWKTELHYTALVWQSLS